MAKVSARKKTVQSRKLLSKVRTETGRKVTVYFLEIRTPGKPVQFSRESLNEEWAKDSLRRVQEIFEDDSRCMVKLHSVTATIPTGNAAKVTATREQLYQVLVKFEDGRREVVRQFMSKPQAGGYANGYNRNREDGNIAKVVKMPPLPVVKSY
jgi:hypothetical protein